MANCLSDASVRQIHTLFRVGAAGGLTDHELLDQFLTGDEAEATFVVLIDRHGPMVRSLCRSLLGDHHEADDAFQATFLVLARRAGSIRDKQALASWLYGIAYRVCMRMRTEATRRRALARRLAQRARHEATTGTPSPADHIPELFEEVARLSDRYRAPIVLCYLEGQTHEQAARSLRCPLRTLQTRLLRAKAKLRTRLERRGLAPAIGLLTAGIATAESSAAVAPALPAALAESTAHAAAQFAATRAARIGPTVLGLANQALRGLFWSRLTHAAVLIASLTLGLATTYFSLFAVEQKSSEPVKTISTAEAKPNQPVKTITGRVVDAQGRPIAGAQVWLPIKSDETDQSTARATTDADGHYTLAVREPWDKLPLHARHWSVWAHAKGHQIATANAYQALSAAQAGPVELTLGSATDTSFLVLGPDGRPLNGAVVEPYHIKTPVMYEIPPRTMLPLLRAVTDANGRALLPALRREGLLNVQVTSNAFGVQRMGLNQALAQPTTLLGATPTIPQPGEPNHAAEPAEPIIRLQAVGRIEGRIRASRPEWAAGVTVFVTTSSGPVRFPGFVGLEGSASAVTRPDGSFVIPAIAAGQLEIVTRLDNALPARTRIPENLEVSAGQSTLVEIPLEKAVQVRGMVRVKDTGQPVAGVSVVISYGSVVVSDAKGQFAAFVLPGDVTTGIIALPDGYSLPIVMPPGRHHVPQGTETFDLQAIEVLKP
jgi:RNA polymerase sigma factor (sigma-70 family)